MLSKKEFSRKDAKAQSIIKQLNKLSDFASLREIFDFLDSPFHARVRLLIFFQNNLLALFANH